MDTAILTVLAIMSGAIFRLWMRTESLQKEHSGCQVALAEYRAKLDLLTAAYNELQRQSFATKLSVNDAFVIVNNDCTITGWSEGASRLFGWDGPEVVGRNFVDLLVPAPNRAECRERIKRTVDSADLYFEEQIDTLGLHHNGQVFPILVAASGYRIEKSWTFIGIFRHPLRRLAS